MEESYVAKSILKAFGPAEFLHFQPSQHAQKIGDLRCDGNGDFGEPIGEPRKSVKFACRRSFSVLYTQYTLPQKNDGMREEYNVTVEPDLSLPFNDQYGEGWYMREVWTQDSKTHRTHGPAVTIFHPISLQPLRQEFFRNGQRHCYTGPAIIVRDRFSGEVVSTQFFEKGREVASRDLTPEGP
ncbi:MAG: hypothetical protein WBL20_04780 [Sphingobium sp.]|uniref:hypothetical protein n=1 Tax=Sphingobium sp. TaxID=1912891 RepID=UPI003BB07FBC